MTPSHDSNTTIRALPVNPQEARPRPRESNPKVADRATPTLRVTIVHSEASDPSLAFSIAPGGNPSRVYLVTKRVIDVIGSAVLLVLLAPLMLCVLLLLAVTTRGRPIFCQQRLGHCGRPFPMYKFRTMIADAEVKQHLVANEQAGPVFKNGRDPRVTPLGRWLRSFSIDETPQLFNVLVGDMSLVGPRPPLASEVAQYEPWQRRRLSVQPGLTCWWQVAGRSDIPFDEWVRMDIWYTEHQSLLVDLLFLARTPWSVLCRRGAY